MVGYFNKDFIKLVEQLQLRKKFIILNLKPLIYLFDIKCIKENIHV